MIVDCCHLFLFAEVFVHIIDEFVAHLLLNLYIVLIWFYFEQHHDRCEKAIAVANH